jgi:hypothetical protein
VIFVSHIITDTESNNGSYVSVVLDIDGSKVAFVVKELNDDSTKWEHAEYQSMLHANGNNVGFDSNNNKVHSILHSQPFGSFVQNEVRTNVKDISNGDGMEVVLPEKNIGWFMFALVYERRVTRLTCKHRWVQLSLAVVEMWR